MRKVAAILLLFIVLVGTPILLWSQGALSYFDGIDPLLQYVIIGVFVFPLASAIVGVIMVTLHSREYVYDAGLLNDDMADENTNSIPHIGVGLLTAITQDYSRGDIANPAVYSEVLVSQLQQYIVALEQYRAHGYRMHYEFYHNETHNTHVVRELSDDELVIEIDGIFNYYMEYQQRLYAIPNGGDAQVYMRTPAIARLHIQRPFQGGEWKLVGFWQALSNISIGLATQ